MQEINHIVFDVGNVLLHYNPELGYLDVIPAPDRRVWFLEAVCSPEWNVEQDRGRSWAEAEDFLVRQFPEWENEILAYRPNWPKMVPHAHDEVVELMQELIGLGSDVTLLTNFAADTFQEARQYYPFLDWPRGATVSGEIGTIKPERAIFEHHHTTFDLEPEKTLFIDDSPKNVEGAHEAGWHAILFSNAKTLKEDLERFAIRA